MFNQIKGICFRNKKELKRFSKLVPSNFDLDRFISNSTVKKVKASNLSSMRFRDKYRILYQLKQDIVYVYNFGNRDDVYDVIYDKEVYDVKDYKKWYPFNV